MSDKPKRRYITKAEFAALMGVNRSQVTRAVKSGRINETKSGKIDWKQASEDWENNRSDHLAGTGRANNAKPKGKNLYMEGLPTIPPIKTMEDMGDMEDIDDDHEKTAPVDPDDIGKPPKRNTRAWEDYRERKAKADWAEMRVRKEKGELLERTDVLAVYGATLNGLKTGVLSLPQRTTMKIMGIVKEWMATQNIAVDANRLIFLEKSVQDAVAAESHFVLTDILHKIENVTQEADTIAEKRR
jgi:hypothetical protein